MSTPCVATRATFHRSGYRDTSTAIVIYNITLVQTHTCGNVIILEKEFVESKHLVSVLSIIYPCNKNPNI